jgi:hypothetical protein
MPSLAEVIDSRIKKRVKKVRSIDTAKVTSVNSATCMVNVQTSTSPDMGPGGAGAGTTSELQNVPVAQFYVGNNFGQVVLPHVGDRVVIGYMGGEIVNPIVLGVVYQTPMDELDEPTPQITPPLTNPNNSDELYFKHISGSSVKFLPEGDIIFQGKTTGSYIKIDKDGDIIIHVPSGKKIKMQQG